MSNIKLLMYAFFSEQSALLAVFSSHPVWQRAVLFFTGHFISSILFSMLVTAALPRRFTGSRPWLLAFFFCFNFFIPALGAVGTLTVLLYFLRFYEKKVRPEFFHAPLPPFMSEAADPGAGMGEGGAWSRLRAGNLPREQRLKALLAVGAVGGGNAGNFLQQATADHDDEIRLLAFNLCERQEQTIQKVIASQLAELETADTPERKGILCQGLAFSYWEMIYRSLVQQDLRDFFMEKAAYYSDQALLHGSGSSELRLLICRISLYRGDLEKARESIQAAVDAGADSARALPYQAELAFYSRDLKEVRRLLAQEKALRLKPGIGPVARFWSIAHD